MSVHSERARLLTRKAIDQYNFILGRREDYKREVDDYLRKLRRIQIKLAEEVLEMKLGGKFWLVGLFTKGKANVYRAVWEDVENYPNHPDSPVLRVKTYKPDGTLSQISRRCFMYHGVYREVLKEKPTPERVQELGAFLRKHRIIMRSLVLPERDMPVPRENLSIVGDFVPDDALRFMD